jgi:hypothetical protein
MVALALDGRVVEKICTLSSQQATPEPVRCRLSEDVGRDRGWEAMKCGNVAFFNLASPFRGKIDHVAIAFNHLKLEFVATSP